MLGLSIYSPHQPSGSPEPFGWNEAIHHAQEEASGVSGAFAALPCRFRVLGPEVGALADDRRPFGRAPGAWVLVTIEGTGGESGHWQHLRERCLTAAQRFILSLACDGIHSEWVDDVPMIDAFQKAGLELGRERPVGLIWCEVPV